MSDGLISRRAAIDAIGALSDAMFKNIEKGATYPKRQWFDGMANAQSIIEDLLSAQQWIPCSERLPEEGVQVLVTDDAGGLATIDVDCGYFDEEYGRFEWFHSQNVTAWMPLPEPYKEKTDEERRG